MRVDPLAAIFVTAGVTTVLLRKPYARNYLRMHEFLWGERANERRIEAMNVLIGLAFVCVGVWSMFVP